MRRVHKNILKNLLTHSFETFRSLKNILRMKLIWKLVSAPDRRSTCGKRQTMLSFCHLPFYIMVMDKTRMMSVFLDSHNIRPYTYSDCSPVPSSEMYEWSYSEMKIFGSKSYQNKIYSMPNNSHNSIQVNVLGRLCWKVTCQVCMWHTSDVNVLEKIKSHVTSPHLNMFYTADRWFEKIGCKSFRIARFSLSEKWIFFLTWYIMRRGNS